MRPIVAFPLAIALIVAAFTTSVPQATRAQDAAVLPGIGDPVIFPIGDGSVTVAVTQVVDPFGAFGADAAPEGSRNVYVVVTIANDGSAPLTVDPATFFVVDSAGFVYRPVDSAADATPDDAMLQTVPPGAEVDGGVVIAVPEDATLAAVYHDPAPDRLILLAVLGGQPGDAEDGGADGGDGQGNGTGGDEGDDDGDDGDDSTAVVVPGDLDCEAFATYYADTVARIERLTEIGGQLEGLVTTLTTDPVGAGETVQGWSDEISSLAAAQGGADVPAGLEDLNDQAIEAFQTYADAFAQLATGLANFDVTAIQSVIPILGEGDDLQTQVIEQLDALAEECAIEVEE